jgi:thiol-disulfide isomerase/thioredoxin
MKYYLSIILSALLLWSCGNKKEFTLSGDVVPTVDGKIILFGLQEGKAVATDTVEIVNGKFKFTGEVDMAELKLMAIEGKSEYVAQLFVEPGKIKMTVYPDSFHTNVIKGSAAQDIFQKYIDEMVAFSSKEEDMKMRFNQARMGNNADEMSAIEYEYQTAYENVQLYSRNFIKEYKSSPVAAYVYLMNFIQEAQLEELDSMITLFEPISTSEFVTAISERAELLRPFSAGAPAPDFTINDFNGTPFSLSSLKGKVVLIDFWASWCQPCMIEMPNIIQLYNQNKSLGFEIVGISLDREHNAWINTVNGLKLEWINAWDMDGDEPGTIANMYGVTGIPHTVLVDKEGKIVATNLRGPALSEKVAQLLN